MKYFILSCEITEDKLQTIIELLTPECLGVWTEAIPNPDNRPRFCFPKSIKFERSKKKRATHETHTGKIALDFCKRKFPSAVRPVDVEDEFDKFGFARSGATSQLAALAKEGFLDRKGRGWYVWNSKHEETKVA